MPEQKVFFVTKENAKCIPVGVKRVKRVWTLYQYVDEKVQPELPYSPKHHTNAFLEDAMHDYSIRPDGMMKYHSGVAGFFEEDFKGVWILVEYEDCPDDDDDDNRHGPFGDGLFWF